MDSATPMTNNEILSYVWELGVLDAQVDDFRGHFEEALSLGSTARRQASLMATYANGFNSVN